MNSDNDYDNRILRAVLRKLIARCNWDTVVQDFESSSAVFTRFLTRDGFGKHALTKRFNVFVRNYSHIRDILEQARSDVARNIDPPMSQPVDRGDPNNRSHIFDPPYGLYSSPQKNHRSDQHPRTPSSSATDNSSVTANSTGAPSGYNGRVNTAAHHSPAPSPLQATNATPSTASTNASSISAVSTPQGSAAYNHARSTITPQQITFATASTTADLENGVNDDIDRKNEPVDWKDQNETEFKKMIEQLNKLKEKFNSCNLRLCSDNINFVLNVNFGKKIENFPKLERMASFPAFDLVKISTSGSCTLLSMKEFLKVKRVKNSKKTNLDRMLDIVGFGRCYQGNCSKGGSLVAQEVQFNHRYFGTRLLNGAVFVCRSHQMKKGEMNIKTGDLVFLHEEVNAGVISDYLKKKMNYNNCQ